MTALKQVLLFFLSAKSICDNYFENKNKLDIITLLITVVWLQ